jgi:hypothetical protein
VRKNANCENQDFGIISRNDGSYSQSGHCVDHGFEDNTCRDFEITRRLDRILIAIMIPVGVDEHAPDIPFRLLARPFSSD